MLGQYNTGQMNVGAGNQGGFRQIVGGYTGSNGLPAQIDQFVRSTRPQVLMAQILNVQKQVVSGMNYKILYKTPKGDTFRAVVYDQSWTNTRKLTSFQKIG